MVIKTRRLIRRQTGTSLVEFTFTFLVFLIFIIAVIEFALAIYDASRLVEATRAATRYAIVNTPSCNVQGKTDDTGTLLANESSRCPATSQLTCTGDSVELVVDTCESPATTPECRMVELMDQMMLRDEDTSVLSGSGRLRITYTCSDTGDPTSPYVVPVITVAAEEVQHPMMFSAIFGFYSEDGNDIGASITLPPFETSRTGEDMYGQ